MQSRIRTEKSLMSSAASAVDGVKRLQHTSQRCLAESYPGASIFHQELAIKACRLYFHHGCISFLCLLLPVRIEAVEPSIECRRVDLLPSTELLHGDALRHPLFDNYSLLFNRIFRCEHKTINPPRITNTWYIGGFLVS